MSSDASLRDAARAIGKGPQADADAATFAAALTPAGRLAMLRALVGELGTDTPEARHRLVRELLVSRADGPVALGSLGRDVVEELALVVARGAPDDVRRACRELRRLVSHCVAAQAAPTTPPAPPALDDDEVEDDGLGPDEVDDDGLGSDDELVEADELPAELLPHVDADPETGPSSPAPDEATDEEWRDFMTRHFFERTEDE